MRTPRARDIVVMGASLGGLEAIDEILAGLPADFPAAIFVVVHVHPSAVSRPFGSFRRSTMPAALAVHGDEIEHGRVYVAPPDSHLLLSTATVEVVRGPREN